MNQRSFKVVHTPEGRANLHIWRTGQSYARQKSAVYLKEWTNLYFSVLPQPPAEPVYYCDVRKGLPFLDGTFDAVFALHIIEHLTPDEGKSFATEIYRILKPGGQVRISTPDMENICREYILQLETCLADPSPRNIMKYDWIMLELLDQWVRDKAGGLMSETVKNGYFDYAYAKYRYGDVFDEFYQPSSESPAPTPQKSLGQRILSVHPRKLYRFIRNKIIAPFRNNRERKLQSLLGDPRRSLEINKWFYDRLSLKLLLEATGFKNYSIKSYKDSDIPHWERYNLDRSNHGDHAIEPSLYVEAKKIISSALFT